MSQKYKIIKMTLTEKKIPIDIQDMILDNLVPEHQKKNIIFHYKNRKNINDWEFIFLSELDACFQEKRKITNSYCIQTGGYIMTRWLESIDDEERQILSCACDMDIIKYYDDIDTDDFHNHIELVLELKRVYEMNLRHRFSFYKLFQDVSLKYKWNWGIIEMMDIHYQNKKKILSECFSNYIDVLYNEFINENIIPNLTFH